jgi:CHAT domain-containing protein
VREVARYAPGAVVRLRSWATESFLKREALRGYRVIHLATHALVDEQSVARTAIALAPGGGEDGFLTPGELAVLDLRADLVVLSACRTAGGVVLAGEGIQGLTAPLLQAGARAVVATAWRIGDRAAVGMVSDFYDALAAGRPANEAMRMAKLAAIRRGAPASEWAAFSVVGDPTVLVPLQRPSERPPWLFVVAGLLPLGLLAVVVARRRAERRRSTL